MYKFKPKYENENPIDDEFEALELLRQKSGKGSKIQIAFNAKEESFLEVGIYSSGYTGDELTRRYYYRITKELINRLKNAGYVKGTPHWGYTDERELRVTEFGENFFYRKLKEYKDLIFQCFDSQEILSGRELIERAKLPRRIFVLALDRLDYLRELIQVGDNEPVRVQESSFENLRFRIKPKTDNVKKEG